MNEFIALSQPQNLDLAINVVSLRSNCFPLFLELLLGHILCCILLQRSFLFIEKCFIDTAAPEEPPKFGFQKIAFFLNEK
jgi:hypothetical protein